MISIAFDRWQALALGDGIPVPPMVKQKKAFTVGGGPNGPDAKTAALGHLCIALGSKSIKKLTMEDVNEAFTKQFTESVVK